MEEKRKLTKLMTLVPMNEVSITTDEKPIIGTQALASCIAIILYNREYHTAIVSHIPSSVIESPLEEENIKIEIWARLVEYGLEGKEFDLKIIEGAYKSQHQKYDEYGNLLSSIDIVEKLVKNVRNIKIGRVDKEDRKEEYQISYDGDKSKQFAFDSRTGEFVTDKVYFGKEYIEINGKHR